MCAQKHRIYVKLHNFREIASCTPICMFVCACACVIPYVHRTIQRTLTATHCNTLQHTATHCNTNYSKHPHNKEPAQGLCGEAKKRNPNQICRTMFCECMCVCTCV